MTVSKSPEDEKREQQRMQDVLVLLQHLTDNEETTIKLIVECLFDVGAINFINREIQNPAINQFTKNIASLSKPIAKRYGLYWFKKNFPELLANWLQRKIAFPPPPPAPLPKTEVENQPDIIQAVDVAEVSVQSDSLSSAVSPQIVAVADSMELQTSSSERSEEGQITDPSLDNDVNSVRDLSLPLPSSQVNVRLQSSRDLQSSLEMTSRELLGADPLESDMRQIHRLRGQVKVLVSMLVGTTLMSGVVIWHLHLTPRSALDLRRSIPSSIIPPE